ncbi:MAG: hypothetical protein H7Y88_10685 [Phycisphaerales bacterium]|nr:hypothetical protein [Phycisphaerales bacterium]
MSKHRLTGTINGMRGLILALVAMVTLTLAAGSALADKLHLKDGRVLEGRIEKEGEGYVYFIVAGPIERTEFFSSDQILRIEKDSDAADAAKPAAPKANEQNAKAARSDTGRATRIAILNFGAPSGWQGEIGDTVGTQIYADAWHKAIPLLEKDNVDVVVVRINSGGGALSEMGKFHKVYQEEYKPKFRTVAWVESAISCAAMSPWVIEEFYMMPEGSIGGCTAWSGQLVAVKDLGLETILAPMEEASEQAGRDYRIMRAMQIMTPLSADIDENGNVTWHEDLSGKYILNDGKKILTFNSEDAVRFKFARAVAATPEELAGALGLQEVEFVGQRAAEFIDKSMRDADRFERRLRECFEKYGLAVNIAQSLQDRTERGAQINRARALLKEMRKLMKGNPAFEENYGLDAEWFERQEEILRELAK